MPRMTFFITEYILFIDDLFLPPSILTFSLTFVFIFQEHTYEILRENVTYRRQSFLLQYRHLN
jgi:hypothetical protein